MSKMLTVNYNKKPIYNIIIENSYDRLSEELKALGAENRKICIVTDSNAGRLYSQEVADILKSISDQVVIFTFEAGEENKTLDTVRRLYEFLIMSRLDRKDILVALGGGVTGDLTGFAAATYLRGIDFIQLPTTLLSQVDSSIGGKTGVDFDSYKNMVGAFHQPRLVYMNISTLNTLHPRQYFSGMGEILKHGLIKDERYFEWLIENMVEIYEKDPEILEEMIYRSCVIKGRVVEEDPEEKGERALLNFGHTIGHAIEKYMDFKLLHGECVALGSVAAAYISWKRGYLKEDEFLEIRDMFVGFRLPVSMESISLDEIINTVKLDKKMDRGQIRFILLKSIGNAFIDKTVTDDELREATGYLCREIED